MNPLDPVSPQIRTHVAEAFRPRLSTRLGLLAGTAGVLLVILVGCGQVITLPPTPTPAPTPTIVVDMAAALPPTPTPAPYTPAPTPTPTVTPTPIIHVIQAGDNLLSIATSFGVSVAALQEVNGILDPRSLQLNQELIIPRVEELAATLDPTITPTPMPIQIQNIHFSENVIGGLWVQGEVLNISQIPLEQVRVGVTLLEDGGQEMASANGLAAMNLIEVGETAPFAILFGAVPGRFDHYQTYAMSAVPAYMGSYYRDLEIADLTSEGERYAAYTVSGRVINVGPEEAVSVQVVVTAYDSLDRVIAMRKVVPQYNVVPKGGETTFSALLAPVGGPVARVAASAQGRRMPPQ